MTEKSFEDYLSMKERERVNAVIHVRTVMDEIWKKFPERFLEFHEELNEFAGNIMKAYPTTHRDFYMWHILCKSTKKQDIFQENFDFPGELSISLFADNMAIKYLGSQK